MTDSKEIRILYFTTLSVSHTEDADILDECRKICEYMGVNVNVKYKILNFTDRVINGEIILANSAKFEPDLILTLKKSGISVLGYVDDYIKTFEKITDCPYSCKESLVCDETSLKESIYMIARDKGASMNYDEEILVKETTDDIKEPVDMVNHPKHYEVTGMECIDVMEMVFGREYLAVGCLIQAFQYISRHKLKNGEEDLDKAEWFLNKFDELDNSGSEYSLFSNKKFYDIREKLGTYI